MKCDGCNKRRNPDRKVTIQSVKDDATPDGNNEIDLTDDDSWEDYCSPWAEILTRGGAERFASDMIQAGQTHRLYVRWNSLTKSITPRMRVKYGTRIMGILAAEDEDQRHQWMQLDVAEAK